MNIAFLKEIYQERKIALLVLLALLLVNVALYLFTSLYQAPRLSTLQRQAEEKRLKSTGGVTQDAAAIYHQGKADLAAWRDRIAPKRDFARFIGELFDVAANNSLKVGGGHVQACSHQGGKSPCFLNRFQRKR